MAIVGWVLRVRWRECLESDGELLQLSVHSKDGGLLALRVGGVEMFEVKDVGAEVFALCPFVLSHLLEAGDAV